jgi:hypothetical protein
MFVEVEGYLAGNRKEADLTKQTLHKCDSWFLLKGL